MTLRDILTHKGTKVWTIQADQTINEALRILVNRRIGALVVVDLNEKVIGIISERDIVRGCHQYGKELNDMPVKKLMTRPVIAGLLDDEIGDIMGIMTDKRVRHIPVVQEGRLEGMISIGDVVKSLLRDSEHQIQSLKEYMYGSSA